MTLTKNLLMTGVIMRDTFFIDILVKKCKSNLDTEIQTPGWHSFFLLKGFYSGQQQLSMVYQCLLRSLFEG